MNSGSSLQVSRDSSGDGPLNSIGSVPFGVAQQRARPAEPGGREAMRAGDAVGALQSLEGVSQRYGVALWGEG